jgi:hypothetical protein
VEDVRERIVSRADDLVHGSALNFLSHFVELGGFQVVLNLLREGNCRPTDEEISADKTKAEREMISLESMVDILSTFVNCD